MLTGLCNDKRSHRYWCREPIRRGASGTSTGPIARSASAGQGAVGRRDPTCHGSNRLKAAAVFAAILFAGLPTFAEGLNLPQIGGTSSQNGFLPQVNKPAVTGESTPADTVLQFIAAMQDGNDDPNLPLYSAASRLMLRGERASDGQMQQVVDTYYRCGLAESFEGTGVAVERYAADARKCPPMLLFRENSRWVLDLVTAAGVIRFNDKDEWHFSGGIPRGYAFAFEDWVLDANGYPFERGSNNPPASPGDAGTY